MRLPGTVPLLRGHPTQGRLHFHDARVPGAGPDNPADLDAHHQLAHRSTILRPERSTCVELTHRSTILRPERSTCVEPTDRSAHRRAHLGRPDCSPVPCPDLGSDPVPNLDANTRADHLRTNENRMRFPRRLRDHQVLRRQVQLLSLCRPRWG